MTSLYEWIIDLGFDLHAWIKCHVWKVVLFIWRFLEKNLEAVCCIFSYAIFYSNITSHNPINLESVPYSLQLLKPWKTKRGRWIWKCCGKNKSKTCSVVGSVILAQHVLLFAFIWGDCLFSRLHFTKIFNWISHQWLHPCHWKWQCFNSQ